MSLINTTVLMSDVVYFDDGQPINPFMDASQSIDLDKAGAEHQRIRQALESAGVTVRQVTSPIDCQDGVYTANWALVRGNKAVMARLPNARHAEEAYAEWILWAEGKEIIHVPDGLRFSGQGDALPCGNYLFCGSQYRSDAEAQAFVADRLGYERIQLQAVPLLDDQGQPVINSFSGWPDSFYYDIDLALSILKIPAKTCTHDAQAGAEEAGSVGGSADKPASCPECRGLIAWCPEAFTPESQKTLRNFDAVDKIEVSAQEATQAFACNLVSTGEVVIMNAGAIQFAADIEAHGLKTVRLSNPELGKGGGSIRCTSLTLDNQ